MKILFVSVLVLLLHGQLFAQNKEQDEIKKVCLAETDAYNNFEFDKLASFHVKGPDDQLAWNNADGSFGYYIGWDKIANGLRDWFAKSEKKKIEQTCDDFQYQIAGDFAFVSYSTTSKNGQGKISKFRDYKTLKRIKGAWKLFTIQAYIDFTSIK